MSDKETEEVIGLLSTEEVEKTAEAVADDEEDDPELAAMKKRVSEMMEEHKKLQEMQSQLETTSALAPAAVSAEDKEARDSRSVYVGNVDYSTTPEELQHHFRSAGSITKITIMRDHYTGQPKGFAYIEFSNPEMVANAVVLNEFPFKGRELKVSAKRTNIPGLKARRGRGRGRGYNPYHKPRARFRNYAATFGGNNGAGGSGA